MTHSVLDFPFSYTLRMVFLPSINRLNFSPDPMASHKIHDRVPATEVIGPHSFPPNDRLEHLDLP